MQTSNTFLPFSLRLCLFSTVWRLWSQFCVSAERLFHSTFTPVGANANFILYVELKEKN